MIKLIIIYKNCIQFLYFIFILNLIEHFISLLIAFKIKIYVVIIKLYIFIIIQYGDK